jgi:hypothetical protein
MIQVHLSAQVASITSIQLTIRPNSRRTARGRLKRTLIRPVFAREDVMRSSPIVASAALALRMVLSTFHAHEPRTQYVPRSSSPRARGDRSANGVRMLWRQSLAQTRRRRDPDAGIGAAPVESGRDGAREVLLPHCEKISQAPAPFHTVARGWAGPSLLAMIMFEKFGHISP